MSSASAESYCLMMATMTGLNRRCVGGHLLGLHLLEKLGSYALQAVEGVGAGIASVGATSGSYNVTSGKTATFPAMVVTARIAARSDIGRKHRVVLLKNGDDNRPRSAGDTFKINIGATARAICTFSA